MLRPHRFNIFGTTIALALCVGCGGSSSNGGGGAGSNAANNGGSAGSANGAAGSMGTAGSTGTAGSAQSAGEQEFRERAPALYCSALQTCCEEAGLGFNPLLCQGLFSQPTATEGVTFHEDAAASCLQLLQEATTCESSGMPSTCDRVYTGSKALGETCSSAADCMPQANGEVDCDLFDSVCSVIRRGELGDACNASCEEIDPGGYLCGNFDNAVLGPNETVQCYRDDGLTCGQALTCQALVQSGEACSSDRDCAEGTFCSFAGTDALCAPLLALGATCSSFGDQCEEAAYCGPADTCVAKKANGETCTGIDEECQGQCTNGLCEPAGDLGDLGTGLLTLFCGGAPTAP